MAKTDGKHPFLSPKPVGFFDSAVGRLAVYPISHGHYMKLTESIGGPLASCDAMEFFKQMIPYICYPAESLGEDESKPGAPSLTRDDVDRLGDGEINAIARMYVENAEYLYRKQITETRRDADGRLVVSTEYGEVEHAKNQGESDVQYLHRLLVLYDERLREQMKSFAKSILGAAHFSQALSQNIAKTLALGESLSKITRGLRLPDFGSSIKNAIRAHRMDAGVEQPLPRFPEMPEIDFEAIEKSRRAPFEALGTRLDQLIELTGDGITFATESSKTQTRIAAEIKSSGESASKLSKLNIALTIVVIAITVIGSVTSWIDRQRSREDAQAVRRYAEQLTTGLNDLSSAVDSSRKTASADLRAVLSEMEKARTTQDKQVRAILEEQARLIRPLVQRGIDDQEAINELRRKVSDLEAKAGHKSTHTRPVERGG